MSSASQRWAMLTSKRTYDYFDRPTMKLGRYKRELSALAAYVALLIVVGALAPAFFGAANLRDLALNNAPTLIVATGMTMVILVGEIDISVGSQFAVCSV